MSEPRRRRRPQMIEIEREQETAADRAVEPEHVPEYKRAAEPEHTQEYQQTAGPEYAPEHKRIAGPEHAPEHKQTAEPKHTFKHTQDAAAKLALDLKQAIEQSRAAKQKAAPEQTRMPIELEMMDAHGSGAAERRKRQEEMRRKILRERLFFAAMAVCVIVAAVSLTMIVKIAVRSIRTRITNHDLAKKRAELSVTVEPTAALIVFMPEETPEPAQSPAPYFESIGEEAQGFETEMAETPTTEPEPTPTARKKDVVKSTQYHVAGGQALPHMEALYEENRDLIGWLRMEEILDLPVMYRDNSYYLKRDFYKNKNESGTLFLDQNHRFTEWTQNLLLHGHNMKDGTMFGRLTHYLNLSYMKNNPFVHFDTLWREEQYVIFAVLKVSLDVKDEAFFNYFSYPTFASDAEFNAYIRRLQLRSEYAIPIDVAPSDALLTLSTCLNDDRLVIVCRRVRENETRSELRQAVHLAVKQ